MATYDAGLSGGAYLRLTVTQTSQNIAANTSTDSWSVVLHKGSFASWSSTPIAWSANIGGTGYSGSYTFDFRYGSTSQLLGSGSTVVTHNPDGTKSTSVSGYTAATGTSTGGPATASGSFAQTNIPRGPKVEYDGAWSNSILSVEYDGAWVTGLLYAEYDGAWVIAA